MNERIRQLAIQAGGQGVKMSTIGLSLLGEEAIEHFAELLVAECTAVVERNLYQQIGYNTSRQVRKHFGMYEEE